jgi:hypothetical protein
MADRAERLGTDFGSDQYEGLTVSFALSATTQLRMVVAKTKLIFSTLLFNHPADSAVNKISPEGNIHRQIAKMG